MTISIIIVSWNVKELLKKCLGSIYQNQGDLALEIFVVDNASNDGTPEMVKNEFPKVKLIANNKNLGFARANNQAIKLATGDYVLFLNPDTEIFVGTLQKSVDFINSHSDCGILGAQILNPDKTIQLSVRRLPTLWPIFLMLLKLPKIFPHLKSVEHYLYTDFDYLQEQTVDQVMGAFMFTKKEIIEKVGLFDERFFLWFEEVDFCRRVKQAGYEVYYSPMVQIVHYGGTSFARQSVVTKQSWFFRSALLYFLKHGIFYPKNI